MHSPSPLHVHSAQHVQIRSISAGLPSSGGHFLTLSDLVIWFYRAAAGFCKRDFECLLFKALPLMDCFIDYLSVPLRMYLGGL